MTILLIFVLAWASMAATLLIVWRHPLLALWNEPVFIAPILILESDDWGAGPSEQAAVLTAIADHLASLHDSRGKTAVMTLALILAIRETGLPVNTPWRQCSLNNERSRSVMAAINSGQVRGVFALQLHGLEHYWPAAVMEAAKSSEEVRTWLNQPDLTEHLPSHLQSRWTDASVLPSRPHLPVAVNAAVAEETRLYAELFGAAPVVVVPPTFVWTESVEAAWAAAGVEVIVTPGRRYTGRDASGRPAYVDREMLNGQRGSGDVIYLVRDDYFEPIFGHRPDQALAALARKTSLGRPCLLETHRWNFLAATGGDLDTALASLDTLYSQALKTHPDLRFASCAELAQAIRSHDPAWIEPDLRRRFTIWTRRAAQLPRFGKLARLSGLLPLLQLLARLLCSSDRRP